MIETFKERTINDSYLDAISKFYKNNDVIEETIKMIHYTKKCVSPTKHIVSVTR